MNIFSGLINQFATEARWMTQCQDKTLYLLYIVIEAKLNNILGKFIKSDQNWADHAVAY